MFKKKTSKSFDDRWTKLQDERATLKQDILDAHAGVQAQVETLLQEQGHLKNLLAVVGK